MVHEFSRQIADNLRRNVDLALMAGFLSLWNIPPDFPGKVLNIHPALLPKLGGQGMHGHHVHEAVLAAGEKVSGCTVHFADNAYDHGPIILQRPRAPHRHPRHPRQTCLRTGMPRLPQAIRLFAEGKARIGTLRTARAGGGTISTTNRVTFPLATQTPATVVPSGNSNTAAAPETTTPNVRREMSPETP